MSGLDRIIENIAGDAKAKCDAIEKEAREKAAQITEEARRQAGVENETLLLDTEARLDVQKRNAAAGALLRQRNSILEAKLAIMDQVVAQAKETLAGLPDREYFDVLFTLTLRYAQNREGEMLLNARDLSRLPEDFERRIHSALGDRGSIRVNPQPREIESGFVLVYGGMEENCAFEALFEAQKDALRDKLHAILF